MEKSTNSIKIRLNSVGLIIALANLLNQIYPTI